jgi:hypothetical protein
MRKFVLILELITLSFIGCEKEQCWECHTISTQHNYRGSMRKEIYCDMTDSQIEAIITAGFNPPEYHVECHKLK